MDAKRWYELAQDELKKQKYQNAKDLLLNAIQQKEDFVEAHSDLAMVYIHQGKFEEALEQYKTILDLEPSIDNRIKHAGLLLFLDKAANAEQAFSSILQEEPENINAIKGLGDSYFRQNKFDQAHQQYDHLLELQPENGFLWYSKAEAYYRAQDHEKSFEAIEKAIDLEQEPEFFAFKGDFFIRHDNYERALEQYTLAANLAPKDAEIQMRLGFIFRILERERDAIEAFDKALNIDPYLTEAIENKIEIYRSQGKDEAALGLVEQLVRLEPDDLETGLELANYYIDNKGYERAAEIFEILIEVHFENAKVWYGLATSLFHIEEYKRANQAIMKTIEFDEGKEEYLELKEKIKTKLSEMTD